MKSLQGVQQKRTGIYRVGQRVHRAAARHRSALRKAAWALFAEKLRKGFLRPSQRTDPAGTASPAGGQTIAGQDSPLLWPTTKGEVRKG